MWYFVFWVEYYNEDLSNKLVCFFISSLFLKNTLFFDVFNTTIELHYWIFFIAVYEWLCYNTWFNPCSISIHTHMNTILFLQQRNFKLNCLLVGKSRYGGRKGAWYLIEDVRYWIFFQIAICSGGGKYTQKYYFGFFWQ